MPLAKYYLHKKEIRVFNHLNITVEVHQSISDKFRIVGFEVEPLSIDWGLNPCGKFSDPNNIPPMNYNNETEYNITHTYSIRIKKSDAVWADRFDHYVKTGSDNVHHIQFFISVTIALIFFWIVRCCIYRIVAKDFNAVRRNQDKLKKARDYRRDQVSNTLESSSESKSFISKDTIEDESDTMKDL